MYYYYLFSATKLIKIAKNVYKNQTNIKSGIHKSSILLNNYLSGEESSPIVNACLGKLCMIASTAKPLLLLSELLLRLDKNNEVYFLLSLFNTQEIFAR